LLLPLLPLPLLLLLATIVAKNRDMQLDLALGRSQQTKRQQQPQLTSPPTLRFDFDSQTKANGIENYRQKIQAKVLKSISQ